jgi:hypothetical protein
MMDFYIVTWRLKADATIGTQRHCKPLTTVTNKHSTVEDVVFLALQLLGKGLLNTLP